MKKIKYLMPIIGLTGLASAAIPLTSCTTSGSRQIVISTNDANFTQSTNLDGDLVIILKSKETSKIIVGIDEIKIGDNVLSSSEYYFNNNKATIKKATLTKYSGNICITPKFEDSSKIVGLTLTPPTKKEYYIGDKLDLTGMVLKTNLLDGSTKTITEGYTVTPSLDTPLTEDDDYVTIGYAGKKASFEISVAPAPITLTKIEVTTLPKTTYVEDDELDLSGMVVTGTYSDGSTAPITEGYTTDPEDGTVLTTSHTKVVVTCQGKSTEFALTITPISTCNFVTLSATSTTTVTWTKGAKVSDTTWLQYKLGENEWTDMPDDGTAITFGTDQSDQTLKLRGYLGNAGTLASKINKITIAASTATVKLAGSMMNLLLDQSTLKPSKTLPNYAFYNLFRSSTGIKEIDESTYAFLPAKTCSEQCYKDMFYGCTNLTNAPKLPAETLATSCYYEMFYGCKKITEMPELNATTLADYCYYQMFYQSGIKTAKPLPAQTLTKYCYYRMFYDCDDLEETPEIKATTLADSCCSGMFFDSGIKTAKPLLAETLQPNCYYQMFRRCFSLKTLPIIHATTLASSSCSEMFYYCQYLKINSTGTGTEFFTCPSDADPSTQAKAMFAYTSGITTEEAGTPTAGSTYYYENE